MIFEGIKVSDYPFDELTVQGIFLHNHNWDVYRALHNSSLRDEVVSEVAKMLSCRDDECGFVEYYCEYCGESRTVYFGCNSRICSRCGKPHSDNWARTIASSMYDVPHRHAVLSLPDRMWDMFRDNWDLLKVLMDSVMETLDNVMNFKTREDIEPGAVVILHPFSRDVSFKPHVHILMIEGGFTKKGRFKRKGRISYEAMRKVWQYTILTNLKKALPPTPENSQFIADLFKRYPMGFYAHLPKESTIWNRRQISKYLGRYIRHPAIANFRLVGYDGRSVCYWYKDNDDNKHYKTVGVFEFIEMLIQHIPKKHFKMVRHYGAYSRRSKSKYRRYVSQESLAQKKLDDFSKKPPWICPKCQSTMVIVRFRKKPPPDPIGFGGRVEDWQVISKRGLAQEILLTK